MATLPTTEQITLAEIERRLKSFQINARQQEALKKFKGNPQGRNFLPLVAVLFELGLDAEAFDLLEQGLHLHASFTPARIVAAEEYLLRGNVANAWRVLEDSPVSLWEYVPAQVLKLKLSILLLDEKQLTLVSKYLRQQAQVDSDLQKYLDIHEIHGIEAARKELLYQLKQQFPQFKLQEDAVTLAKVSDASMKAQIKDQGRVKTQQASDANSETEADGNILPKASPQSMDGFYILPVKDVMATAGSSTATLGAGAAGNVELDSLTLADIYERQGYISKSLNIYRRLLKVSPGNRTLQAKISDLSQQKQLEKLKDLQVDAKLVDKIEEMERVERQINFYNSILAKLDLKP